ncbi:hypothetical protein JG688_00012359, partial [Phytophthora aleatoria]
HPTQGIPPLNTTKALSAVDRLSCGAPFNGFADLLQYHRWVNPRSSVMLASWVDTSSKLTASFGDKLNRLRVGSRS